MMVSMRDELTMSTFKVNFGNEGQKLRIERNAGAFSLNRGKNWNKNPATEFNDDDNDYSDDTFATFDATAHITNAVLRLSGVRILNGDSRVVLEEDGKDHGKRGVTPSIVVSLSQEESPPSEAKTDPQKRKYDYDYDNPTFDVNIDVLKQANLALKPPCNLYVTIASSDHDIEVDSIHLLLSVAQKKKG